MAGHLLSSVSSYVSELFFRQLSKDFLFHNKQHTLEVVEAVSLISGAYNLSEKDRLILLVAAWFHDTGYCYLYKGHEEQSMVLADGFLAGQHCDTKFINEVKQVIAATETPQHPIGLLQEILCDADLAHLSKADYVLKLENLRQEWAICLNKTFDDVTWLNLNLSFLEKHAYFTFYAQQQWQPLKANNLAILHSKL